MSEARRLSWADQWTAFVWAVVVVPPAGLVAAVCLAARGRVDGLDVALCAAMSVATLVGIEVGFHRHFAHRSFKAAMPLRLVLGALGSMALQGSVLWWAGVHRTHHRYA